MLDPPKSYSGILFAAGGVGGGWGEKEEESREEKAIKSFASDGGEENPFRISVLSISVMEIL